MGKIFSDPQLLLLLTSLVALLAVYRRSASRRGLVVPIGAVVTLLVLSTVAFSAFIERPLELPPTATSLRPAVVVVLTGGSHPSPDPGVEDLSDSSRERIDWAVRVWRSWQSARLVISGGDDLPGRLRGAAAEAMMREALAAGVPRSAIVLEVGSLSTFEHPLRLQTLPGIDRDTPIALVTSRWHMRRAAREFRRHFRNVILRPVPGRPEVLTVRAFIPSSKGIHVTTLFVWEWVGIVWYSLRNALA